jgi:nicotinamide-nucleotide adenylyltransferase
MTIALLIGRFQPFHNGHLEVVKKILGECDYLIIGIGSSQYSKTEENPFSGDEREHMIYKTLKKEDLVDWEIVQVPDIHDEERWVNHVQKICPAFDLVYSGNPNTKKLFEEANVEVRQQPMYDREKYSGTEIRGKILTKKSWKELVPKSVSESIRNI